MSRTKIQSSERRGIIAVAAIALLVTLSGMLLAWCRHPLPPPTPEEIEILSYADSATILSADSAAAISRLPDSLRRSKRIIEARKAVQRRDSLKELARKQRKLHRDSVKARRKSSGVSKKKSKQSGPVWRSPRDERL